MSLITKNEFFGPNRRVVTASAPGRLDVMGGIADYSGSLVLEMPIRERTTVWAARREDGLWRAYSSSGTRSGFRPMAQARTSDIATPDKARVFFSKNKKLSWAAYVLGSVPLLLKHKKMIRSGADLYLSSDVPMAKGLSSSASIEVASTKALGILFKLSFKKNELPRLCQETENLVAGAPCGLMDQLTCYLGKQDKLLPILCQPDKLLRPLAIPKVIQFVGLDSGVKHWVGGSSYQDVRTAAFMGYSLIAMKEGASKADLSRAKKTGDASQLPYQGYLARISPRRWEDRYSTILPLKMRGRDFLNQCSSTDQVTKVQPDRTYSVRAAASHPIYENNRVHRFKNLLSLLNQAPGPVKKQKILQTMGGLMFESHTSYGVCGLGEPVTDSIVRLAKIAGPSSGIYGAKITGGGSGGTVCFLIQGPQGLKTVKKIAASLSNPRPFITQGSSNGGYWN